MELEPYQAPGATGSTVAPAGVANAIAKREPNRAKPVCFDKTILSSKVKRRTSMAFLLPRVVSLVNNELCAVAEKWRPDSWVEEKNTRRHSNSVAHVKTATSGLADFVHQPPALNRFGQI